MATPKQPKEGEGEKPKKPTLRHPSEIDPDEEIKFKIREYKSDDYQQVFQMIYDTSVEPWTTAYLNTLSPSKKTPLILRLVVLATGLQFAFPWPLILSMFYEIFIMAYIYLYVYLYPAWTGIMDNLVEYSLSSWTARPGKFFVATKEFDDKKVVGCVTFKLADSADSKPKSAALHRLAVTQDHRYRGLGRQLVETVRKYVRTLGARRLTLGLTDGHDDALVLADKMGFELMAESPYAGPAPFLHLVHDVRRRVYELKLE